MVETYIYFWTDPAERAYVRLRERGGHWNLEWGFRDPPASDNYVERAEHTTSVRDEAVRLMLDRVRALSPDPTEVGRAERKLREALRGSGR